MTTLPPDDDWVDPLLRRLDHPLPRVDADAIRRRARQSRSRALRPAAAVALLLGMAAAAYALPGSPVPGWVRALVNREQAGPVTPQRPGPLSPELAGIAVDPGTGLLIVFRSTRSRGEVRVGFIDSAEVIVRGPAALATFTSNRGRLLIDNAGAADFELLIPRTAPRIEVRAGDLLLLRKEGTRVTVTKHRLDGSSGNCTATEETMSRDDLSAVTAVIALSLAGCTPDGPAGPDLKASFQQQLDLAICAPTAGGFTAGSTNPWFPLQVGNVWRYEGEEDGEPAELTITVLNQTETVAGVVTRVVEEREELDGELVEVSRNYFAQASDGTVCYFGEAVDIYHDDGSVTHEGAWRADQPGNAPGIAMPASPTPGVKFQMEAAPGIAEDEGTVVGTGKVTVPAGTFTRTIRVREANPLDGDKGYKWYAHGTGLLIDGPVKLVQYQ
ncbi:MAG TPA: hypothetical protein VFO95_00585 [Gemmatimonadales bacterium]|nr:hypothetical protein [Gemmatimonadales bacterium]